MRFVKPSGNVCYRQGGCKLADGADGFTFKSGEKSTINDSFQKLGSKPVNNHTHIYGKSSLIANLYAVECVVSYPETYIRDIWCSFNEYGSLYVFEDKFDDAMKDSWFWITSSAVSKILAWRAEQEPVPEPEPTPDPVDEGNGIIDGIVGDIKEWIKQAILAGLAFLEEPLNLIKDIIGKVGNAISTFASTMQSAISTIMANVMGMFETIAGKIKGVIDEVWNNIQLIWETLKDVYDTIKTAIVTAFKTSWVYIKETFTILWEKMKEGLTWIGKQIVEGIKFLWEKIVDGLNWVSATLKSAYTALKDVLIAVWDRTKERLQQTIESIKIGFGDAVDRLKDILLWLWEQVQAVFDKIFDMSEEAIEEMGYRVLTVQKRILERFVKEEGKV